MKGFIVGLFTPKKYKLLFKDIQLLIKGKKSYLIGLILMLQGLAKMLDTFTGFDGLGQFVVWVGTAMQSDGGKLLLEGFALCSVRAGISKIK